LSDAFREKLQYALETMERRIADLLEDAKSLGEISENIDTQETAGFILSSYEGALIRMKISKNALPYKTFKKMIFHNVLRL
jgi:TetR/AcrR family transcriptional repressor of nem operon